jgi:hypothetical protein
VLCSRSNARDELGDHAVGKLGPTVEEFVEHDLVDPQDERRLDRDHRRGAWRRYQRGELANRCARAQLDDAASTALHPDTAVDDRIQVGLDRSLLHEDIARLSAHLDRRQAYRSQHAAGNPGEELDAMERRHALDDPERRRRRRRPVGHVVERNPPGAERPTWRCHPRALALRGAFDRGRAPRRLRQMAADPTSVAIDHYLPDDVREVLEDRFWQAIEEVSRLEAVWADPSLASAPDKHPALFADHGVVHARDVAAGVLELAGVAHGRLLPERSDGRQAFVVGLAILQAYIHDVGMTEPTAEGRRMHAVQAAQIPHSGKMDDVLARLWASGGPVVSRIRSVSTDAPFDVPDEVVLRELASLAVGHSKSTVPAALHADFTGLRRLLQHAVLVDLDEHRAAGRLNPAAGLPTRLGTNARWYEDPARDAFSWLESRDPVHRRLADDAVDAVRLLRAADALRQRGTGLRTAAGYEIFIDADTGQAVFSFRTAPAGDRLLLLRVDSPYSAGEANVRDAVVTPNGDVRVSFHRGRFSSAAAAATACTSTARVVADIGADVLGAFAVRRPTSDLPPPTRDPGSMRVELERPADEPAFAELVAECAVADDPSLLGRIFVVAGLEYASAAERARYLEAIPIADGSEEAAEILDALDAHGMLVAGIDRARAFEDVRRVRVRRGEVLLEVGAPPAFVYVAVDCALRIEQRGGYDPLDVPPWIPIGVTGVVRRAERNATVVVSEPGEVLMIPGELFVREWFRPYEESEIGDVLAAFADDASPVSPH